MADDVRDQRFLAAAVACGALDRTRASAVLAARAGSPPGEMIEASCLRLGYLTPDGLARVVAHARRSLTTSSSGAFAALPGTGVPTASSGRHTVAPGSGRLAASGVGFGSTASGSAEPPPSDEQTLSDSGSSGAIAAATRPDAPRGAIDQWAAGPLGSSTAGSDARTKVDEPGARRTSRQGLVGSVFGSYEVLSEIARGGMGVVYRARKVGETEEVALKLVLDEDDPTPTIVGRFQREVRAGREIDHPGVVKILDAGSVDKRLFFTMELVDGSGLDKLLPELDRRTRVEILEKVARAVHAAHEKGFVHRDLKPGNVLVTKDLEPKVADFGLAKSLDRASRLTKTGAVIGTIVYMSPEQAEGGGADLDFRTDVYSLGAMLYQMACGKVPFREDTQYATLKKILTNEPPDPCGIDPTCPRDLATIALRALEKDREKRFSSALVFAEELARWLAGNRVQTKALSPVERAVRFLARHRAGAIALLLLALGAGAGGLALRVARARASARAALESAVNDADATLERLADEPTADLREELGGRRSSLDSAFEKARDLIAPDGPLGREGVERRRRALRGALCAVEPGAAPASQEELESCLATALEVAPARADVRLALGRVLEQVGRPEAAVDVLAAASGGGPELALALARVRIELGDRNGAVVSARGATTGTASVAARATLARALALAGDAGAARAAVEGLTPTSKEDVETRLVLAEVKALEDPGGAVFDLRALERAFPSDPEVSRRLVELLLRQGRADEAVTAGATAATLAPKDARAPLLVAQARVLLGDVAGAREAIETVRRLDAPGRRGRARAAALEALVEELDAPPDDPSARARALDVLAKALAERPGDSALEAARAVRAGPSDPKAGAALEAAARALGTRPEAGTAWAARARALAAAGDPAGARAAAGEALKIERSAEALEASARAVALAGDRDGARALRAEAHAAFARDPGLPAACHRLAGSWWRTARASQLLAPLARERAARLEGFARSGAPWAAAPLLALAARRREDRLDDLARAPGAPPDAEGTVALAQELDALVALAGGDDPDALALLALVRVEAGLDPRDAAARALKLGPTCPRAIVAEALVRGLATKGGVGLDAIERALDDDPLLLDGWRAKGRVLEAQAAAAPTESARARLGEQARFAALHASPRRFETALRLADSGSTKNLELAFDLDRTNGQVVLKLLKKVIGINAGSMSSLPGNADPFVALTTAIGADPECLNRVFDFGETVVGITRQRSTGDDNDPTFEHLWNVAAIRTLQLVYGVFPPPPQATGPVRLAVERALALEPTYLTAVGCRGMIYALEGETRRARADLERALATFKRSGVFNYGLLLVELKEDRPAEVERLRAEIKDADKDLHSWIDGHLGLGKRPR